MTNRKSRAAAYFVLWLCLAVLVGCVAPGDPIKPTGEPNYDTMATLQHTASVLQEAAAAFAQGAGAPGGVDPWSLGGGLAGGLVMAALAAWRKIGKIRKEQEEMVAKARAEMPPVPPENPAT